MSQSSSPDDAPATAPDLPSTASAHELAAGLRFVHLMGTQSQARTQELSASLYALLEQLIADGKLSLVDYEKRRQQAVARENERAQELANVLVAPVADKYALADLPKIDCAERMPLCRARCCRLGHLLSVQDLDEQVVHWDYGRPYLIARGTNGHCVHQSESDGSCGVYDQRPASCRLFDCREDPRIWKDFTKRIPAD